MKSVLAEIRALERKIAGETGPRGGKIIGKTRSGKPVYETKKGHEYKEFSLGDHKDAATIHGQAAANTGDSDWEEKTKHHRDMANSHKDQFHNYAPPGYSGD